MSKKCVLVAYTDGSSVETKGDWVGGFGVHGYLIMLDEPTKKGYSIGVIPTAVGYKNTKDVTESSDKLTVYKFFDYYEPLLVATNNVAELSAVIMILKTVTDGYWKETLPEIEIVSIYLKIDSKYVIEGYTKHLDKWAVNDWLTSNKGPVANAELWKEALSLKQKLNVPVTMEWVDRNSGDFGNCSADYLSRCGRVTALNIYKELPHVSLNALELSDSFNLHDQIDLPDLIKDYNRLYFNSGISDLSKKEDTSHYYLGRIDSKDEHLTAMRKTDISMAIVMTKDPLEFIDSLLSYYNKLLNYDDIRICRLNLDVLKSRNMKYVVEHKLLHPGNTSITPPGKIPFGLQRAHVAYDPQERAVARDFNPSGLSLKLLEHYSKLSDIYGLAIGVEADHPSIEILMVKSIIPTFYSQVENKKGAYYTLRKDIGVGHKEVPVDIMLENIPVQVIINLGYDCYTRNALARIAEELIDIELVVFREHACEIRFVTLIKTISSTAIVSSVFTNRIFI